MFLDELKLKNAQIVSSQLFDILFPIFLCLFKTINDTFWDFLVKIARNKTHSYLSDLLWLEVRPCLGASFRLAFRFFCTEVLNRIKPIAYTMWEMAVWVTSYSLPIDNDKQEKMISGNFVQ